jgi:hypothetical protein
LSASARPIFDRDQRPRIWSSTEWGNDSFADGNLRAVCRQRASNDTIIGGVITTGWSAATVTIY